MVLQPPQQTFLVESRELLVDMENALLKLEHTPDDAEAINPVFRAAHTIKGSAGIFGFDDIVSFTHVMENLLEEIRAGRVTIDADLVALLLQCGDHVSKLLLQTIGENRSMDAETRTEDSVLIARLKGYLKENIKSPAPSASDADYGFFDEPGKPVGNVSNDAWHISLRFGKDVLRNGMDPLSFVRYLETMGEITHIATIFDAMPDAEAMDPESCYIGLEIDILGAVDKNSLEDAFEFVRDDCLIRILPPNSKILDYIELINELPENKGKLGELLVSSGALTEIELEEGLLMQQQLNELDIEKPGQGGKPKLGEILVGQGVVQNELVDAALKKQDLIKENRAIESSFMRVRADKLDELIALVGEFVIAGAGNRLQAQLTRNNELIESASALNGLVEQIRDNVMRLRMVPIGDTFNRFNRVVRDLGKHLNKRVELVITGAGTELDKSMVDKIGDPLMHLVRNSMDHGIESAETRLARGKPETGHLYLNSYHDSGSIVIEVADDGGGLDRDKILAKALERGLITPDQRISDNEIYGLIMEAGFSTATEVTNVSGRGMGMDVVKRNIESLRGNIAIDSISGVGTTVAIRLPLTLAIIDGFLVAVGASSYVVPLDTVVECLELSEADRAELDTRSYVNLREAVLPLLRLRDTFEVTAPKCRRENIVVVKYAGQQAGLVVDALQGEFKAVIKPLGTLFEHLSGISGSTILGNGDVALIIDVPALLQKAKDQGASSTFHPPARRQSLPKQTL
jgi:two-component system, chemotaxis family, sensor kinase CheA